MKTRDDYLNKRCTQREYYAQFVNDGTIQFLVQCNMRDRIKRSKDPHFNDIPLATWDGMTAGAPFVEQWRLLGDFPSLSSKVCALKEAARQLKEELETKRKETR